MTQRSITRPASEGGGSAFLLFPCLVCSRRGAYLVPGRSMLRCKYCRWLKPLGASERQAVEECMAGVLRARDGFERAALDDKAAWDNLVVSLTAIERKPVVAGAGGVPAGATKRG